MKYVGRISVADASGCRFDVHEYHERRLFTSVRHFKLDSGERVDCVGADCFVIRATGETLVRVD